MIDVTNEIRTVGDLKKILSMIPDEVLISFVEHRGYDGERKYIIEGFENIVHEEEAFFGKGQMLIHKYVTPEEFRIRIVNPEISLYDTVGHREIHKTIIHNYYNGG